MKKAFPCILKTRYRDIKKYTDQVNKMIKEAEENGEEADWEVIESHINKLKRLDFK